jgi:hypothetical protein
MRIVTLGQRDKGFSEPDLMIELSEVRGDIIA